MTQITTFRAVMNPGMEHEKIRGFHAVTNAAANAKKLTALLKKLGTVSPPEMPGVNDPVGVLVISTLMWESTTEKAITAYNRLMEQVVDFNDLRVCMPEEVVSVIGARYPKAQERSERLRAMLRNIYLREHAVSLDRLADGGKRDGWLLGEDSLDHANAIDPPFKPDTGQHVLQPQQDCSIFGGQPYGRARLCTHSITS